MSEGIKSGIALELETIDRVQKEINELCATILNTNKLFGVKTYDKYDLHIHGHTPVGYISWDDDYITRKIDMNDLVKEKPAFPRQDISHTHTWVKYTGLSEQFEYCSWCDIRRDREKM